MSTEMMVSKDKIKSLMDDVRKVHESPDNQNRAYFWQIRSKEDWQPAFIRTLPKREPGNKIPFVVEPGLGMWSQILGFNLGDYYSSPLTYLTAQLEMKLYHARMFKDDTFIDKTFRLMFATTLEASLMGAKYNFTRDGHPWIEYSHPPIKSLEDIQALVPPDFFRSGVMPIIHRFYEEINTLLDEDFLVKFPEWIMGPLGVAIQLRGFEAFLMDLIDAPENSGQLIEKIITARKHWQSDLDKFLGVQRTHGVLGNDDINVPIISPAQYRDIFLPIEHELCNYYGSIFYWHSCGNVTKLLPMIGSIRKLELFHCGPWTDIKKACSVFPGNGTAMEIVIEPVSKVQKASREQQKKILVELQREITSEANCFIKVDSLEVISNLPSDLQQILQWIEVAREVLG